jgi:SAM-dependent methyltransferase
MLNVEHELEARFRDREEKRTLARLLPRGSFTTAVELGCGAGRFLPFLANRSALTVGVDVSLGILAQAREVLRPDRGRVVLVGGDVSSLPLAGRVGFVYLSSVTLYLDDAELEWLAKWCAESLPPGGLLVSRDSVSKGERFERGGDYSAIYRPDADYLKVFGSQGFRPIASAPSYVPLRHAAALARRLPHRVVEALIEARALRLVDLLADALARLGRRPARETGCARIAHRFVVYERCP